MNSNTKTSNLVDAMKYVAAEKETENGAYALNSSMDALLDLFGTIGALRTRSEDEIVNKFIKAYMEDKTLALKMLFYARDARGGLGERRTFRVILRYLANNHPDDIYRLVCYIPFYGRWDDLYELVGTRLETVAFGVIKAQFAHDMAMYEKGEYTKMTLLAKWLKSANATSSETRALGRLTAKKLGLTERNYRQALSKMRAALDVVEVKMSANEWQNIIFANVPSIAHKNYHLAFSKHTPELYYEYMVKLASGETKVNARTLYPYDLLKTYAASHSIRMNALDPLVEEQWKALPNYVTDKNFLIMADTSGSMVGLPMCTSVGLAIYFAERNNGYFKDHFITFTDEPRLVKLNRNATLYDRAKVVMDDRYVGYNTNLEAAFELVLQSAIRANVPADEMPEAIVIISDMEIDQFGTHRQNLTFTKEMAHRYAEAGYEMPTLVYWNVDARQDTFHATKDDNVRFVSGSSPSVFKGLCEHMGFTPLELMLNTLNDERYEIIEIAMKIKN